MVSSGMTERTDSHALSSGAPLILEAGIDLFFQRGDLVAICVAGADVGVAGCAEELADDRAAVGRYADLGIVVAADVIAVQHDVDDFFGQFQADA